MSLSSASIFCLPYHTRENYTRELRALESSAENRVNLPLPRRGRKAKLLARYFVPADSIRAREFLKEYGSSTVARDRIRNIFRSCCEMSRIPYRDGFEPFVGLMIEAKLKYSTMETYFSYLAAYGKTSVFVQYSTALALAHADELTKTARTASSDEVKKILLKQKGEFKRGTWFQRITGARWRDIRRLRFRQVRISVIQRKVFVEYWVTKGLRKRRFRRTVALPFGNFPPSPDILEFFTDGAATSPDVRPFAEMTLQQYNKSLKDVCEDLKIDHTTSYSIRRSTIHSFLKASKWDSAKVKKMTAHLQDSTIDAFYSEAIKSQ